jgi:hypothetical protein
VEDLPGRHRLEETNHIECTPGRRVEEESWSSGEPTGESALVGDPGVRDD